MDTTTQPQRPISGFFRSLYDLSFHRFVTPRVIRLVYILALIAAAFWSGAFLLSGFSTMSLAASMGMSGWTVAALVQIVAAPILFVLASLAARMCLELFVAVFKILENLDALQDR